jgi:hypothetical protein
VPPQPGDIEIRNAEGTSNATEANDVGYFTTAAPTDSFLVHCRTTSGVVVQTGWITL